MIMYLNISYSIFWTFRKLGKQQIYKYIGSDETQSNGSH